MDYDLRTLATAIGSLPFKEVEKAVDLVIENLSEIPVCFQLPKLSFLENMYVQYSKNLPCLILDKSREKIYFDTSKEFYKDLEKFYEAYLNREEEFFALTPEYSVGFYAILERLRKEKISRYLKAQVTGPISFAMTVSDQNKRAIYYHKELFQAVVKNLAMKAYWQAKRIKEEGLTPIIFIDEPYLSVLGSGYTNIKREEVIESINEISSLTKEVDAVVGLHCCANTDWSLLCECNIDIISFDSYNYLESICLYKEELRRFLKKGNYLAYGIIPASSEIENEDSKSLMDRLRDSISKLEREEIVSTENKANFIITPSCGVGTLREDLAEKVLSLTKEVSKIIRDIG